MPAQEELVLTVQVINGTAGGADVNGDSVIVEIYEHGKLVNTLNGKAGANGKAVFRPVQTGEHRLARAGAFHQEMRFNGRPVPLRSGDKSVTASVQVFDVSYDNSPLSAVTHHVTIKQKRDALEFSEFIQLRNSSDMAISSEEMDNRNRTIVLRISLPKGFSNFSSSHYLVPEALVFTEDGFFDTMAVPPGSRVWTTLNPFSLNHLARRRACVDFPHLSGPSSTMKKPFFTGIFYNK